eukprot:TRINITY_DN35417_c0_g1_i1.p1 TRINITY_DN35417_c0_g1~~TRINITY_DN35417_c0_g1_i1.p1  ORF type:complete len:404 (+),score=27.05 TRINITY_DN35417_c0_g1_i1:134-1345(+)
MLFAVFLLLLSSPALCVHPPWAFSWSTVSTMAFPGFIPRPFTPTEDQQWAQFTSTDICCVNLTCHHTASGATKPAHCPRNSHCVCPTGYDWIGNEEVSSIAAASAIQQISKKAGKQHLSFPYIYLSISEVWFAAGQEFNNPANDAWFVRDGNGDPIDCRNPKYPCSSQGSEAHVYNFSMPEVRSFFLNKVVAPFANSPHVDGNFFDELEWFWTYWAHRFKIPEPKIQQLRNGTFTMLSELLQYMAAHKKVPVVSSKATKTYLPVWFNQTSQLLEKYGGFRFYEFFCDPKRGSATCLTQIESMMDEVDRNIPIQVHAPYPHAHNYSVEFQLAAFLVACGEYSYFSFGLESDWTVNTWPDLPEYHKPLGKPLGKATRTGAAFKREFEHLTVTCDVAKWKGSLAWH